MNEKDYSVTVREAEGIVEKLDENRADVEERHGLIILFNNYRKGLSNSRTLWGTKVFFNAMIDCGFLKKDDRVKSDGLKYAIDRYVPIGELKKYCLELEGQWGIRKDMELDFTVDLFGCVASKAILLRKMYAKHHEIQMAAKKAMNEAMNDYKDKA